MAKEIVGDLLDDFVECGPADDDADVWLAFALYVSWTEVTGTKAAEQVGEVAVGSTDSEGRPSSQGLTWCSSTGYCGCSKVLGSMTGESVGADVVR